MYFVGWVGCPHCEYREQVCVAVEGPPPAGACLVVRCPNDGSEHRFSLAGFRPAAERPAGLRLEPWPAGPPAAQPATRTHAGLPCVWRVAAIAAVATTAGATALGLWWAWFW